MVNCNSLIASLSLSVIGGLDGFHKLSCRLTISEQIRDA
jgi:hypothetical protein